MQRIIATLRSFSFRDLPVRAKMLMVFGPIIVLPLVLSGVVIMVNVTRSTIDKTISSGLDGSRIVADRLEQGLKAAETCANILVISLNRIHERLEVTGAASDPVAVNKAYLLELGYLRELFPLVLGIVFFDTEGRVFSSDTRIVYRVSTLSPKEIVKLPILKTAALSVGDSIWIPRTYRGYAISDPAMPVTSLVKRIIDLQTGDTLGYILLNMGDDAFSNAWSQGYTQLKGQSFSVVDGKGEVWSSSAAVEGGQTLPWPPNSSAGSQRTLLDWRGRELYIGMPIHRMALELVNAFSLDGLMRDLGSISGLTLAVALLSLGFCLLAARRLTLLLIRPIIQLRDAISAFVAGEGATRATIPVLQNDEIGVIAKGFNSMSSRINELIAQVEREHLEKSAIRLALIQEQIKPHFLYNSLDAIYALSHMGRHEESRITTKALADYYRYALSGGREVVSLEEELRGTSAYLAIQRIRYPDVFEWGIEAPSDIVGQPILKLILQPLAENAIYHGLKEKRGGGKIEISASSAGEYILLEVADDGVGIEPGQLSTIMDRGFDFSSLESGSFWALGNIRQRLALFYGSSAGLEIESSLGHGTVVRLRIPKGEAVGAQ